MFKKINGTIRILHLSDLHIKDEDIDLKDELEAFDKDVRLNFESIDYVVITGDLTYSGKKEQFDLLSKSVLPRLRAAAHVSQKNIIVVPGNHDFDRDSISPSLRFSLERLRSTDDANRMFTEAACASSFSAFRDFVSENSLMKGGVWQDGFCRISSKSAKEFSGKIYYACLNSAWSCTTDRRKGEVYLSASEVDLARGGIPSDTSVRIAIMHHGLDWLQEEEFRLTELLSKSFDVILTGHVHRDVSIAQQSPNAQTVVLTATCFSGDKSAEYTGYNVYDINPVDGNIRTRYRKYVKNGCRFDENVDCAEHGESTLPFKSVIPLSVDDKKKALAFSCLPRVKEDEIVEQLRKTQGLDRPIYIPPILELAKREQGDFLYSTICSDVLLEKSAVLYAPHECGKTIFLEKLAQSQTDVVYVDCSDVVRGDNDSTQYFKTVVRNKLGIANIDAITVIFDHLKFEDSNELELLQTEVVSFGNVKNLLIAVSSEVLYEAILRNKRLSLFSKVRIRSWGVKTIEEFANRFWEVKFPGQKPQIEYLKTSLIHSDIPITPVIVGVFVSLLAQAPNTSSSANLVSLIDRMTELRFGADRYNYVEILLSLASLFYKESRYEISNDDMKRLIMNYYESKNLDYDIMLILKSLEDSRFIRKESDGSFRFAYYVFRDYFIAKAIERRKIELDDISKSDVSVLSNASSLSLFGSIVRDDERLIEKILSRLLEVCGRSVKKDFDLKNLDGFISYLFLPASKTAEEEGVFLDRVREERDQYRSLQAEFDENRRRHASNRLSERKVLEQGDIAVGSYLDRVVMLLRTFYNLYRNLENIPARSKEEYLNCILGFHVYCNLMLIESLKDLDSNKEWQTIVTYIVTLSGQFFLRMELFSPALRKTIVNCLKNEKNDFKRFLLVCLYADGRFVGYEDYLKDFALSTSSHAAIEMLYYKVRNLVIRHSEKVIPDKLMNLFRVVVERRNSFYKKKHDNISCEVNEVKKNHLQTYQWGDKMLA